LNCVKAMPSSKILLLVLISVLMSSCSLLPSNADSVATTKVDISKVQNSANPSEPLDPLTQQVMALQALPNRYVQNSATQTLNDNDAVRYQQAIALEKQGDKDKAKTILLSLSQSYPDLSGLWLHLAQLSGPDEGSQQQRYLQNAIEANPDNYFAHNRLAWYWRQSGEFSQALKHYDLALAAYPAFAEAHLNKAILNDLYLGNKQEAMQGYVLFQALVAQSGQPADKQVAGWIIDLQRQLKAQQAEFNRLSGSVKEENNVSN
jgi:tetratricopeptide (TPR) repeat protein